MSIGSTFRENSDGFSGFECFSRSRYATLSTGEKGFEYVEKFRFGRFSRDGNDLSVVVEEPNSRYQAEVPIC